MKSIRHRIISFLISTSILFSMIASAPSSILITAIASKTINYEDLTAKQQNSLAMLNHLVVLSTEINNNQNDSLLLEEIYSELNNNTNLNALDDNTKKLVDQMKSAIEKYRIIDEKRQRIEYVFEQNKSEAIWEAIPDISEREKNIINNLQDYGNAKKSGIGVKELAVVVGAEVLDTAVDSAKEYHKAKLNAQRQYLEDGWELDDEALEVFYALRDDAFDAMYTVSKESGLPDSLILKENTANEYFEWKNGDNPTRKLQFFENNQDTYQAFGDYWLTMASCYYENEKYQECMDAISTYENMNIHIFSRDYTLAAVLPLAVASANEILEGKKYEETVAHYIDLMTYDSSSKNLDATDDHVGNWDLMYFAAETCLDLYGRTNNKDYLQKAYNITLNNVNHLIKIQEEKNHSYLSAVELLEPDDDDSKEEKKEKKRYNKVLETERKTELAPVYKPLLLNCELLFNIATANNTTSETRTTIEKMLHNPSASDGTLFLVTPIDDLFTRDQDAPPTYDNISFSDKSLEISAEYITENAEINVSIKSANGSVMIGDWILNKIDREKTDTVDISDIKAVFNSATAKKYSFKDGDQITVSITPMGFGVCEPFTVEFKAVVNSKFPFNMFKTISFERVHSTNNGE